MEDKVNEQLPKCSVTVTLDWDPGAGPVGELTVLADDRHEWNEHQWALVRYILHLTKIGVIATSEQLN